MSGAGWPVTEPMTERITVPAENVLKDVLGYHNPSQDPPNRGRGVPALRVEAVESLKMRV